MIILVVTVTGQGDNPKYTRWWFQILFIFTPIWGRFPCWLIFFKWVETTNQYMSYPPKTFQTRKFLRPKKFPAEGQCKNGDACKYAHGTLELGMVGWLFVSPKNFGAPGCWPVMTPSHLFSTIYRGYNFIYNWWFVFLWGDFWGFGFVFGKVFLFGHSFLVGAGWCFSSFLLGVLWLFWCRIYNAKSPSILIGFSSINHPIWGSSIFGNTHNTSMLVSFILHHPFGRMWVVTYFQASNSRPSGVHEQSGVENEQLGGHPRTCRVVNHHGSGWTPVFHMGYPPGN